jgi:3-hydroxyisobutyrate dehydrogenase-like beta-hydroxyacid dehydrogenase
MRSYPFGMQNKGDKDVAREIETLGFIGLGVMGEPMCRNLLAKGGRPVFGTDRRREPVERLREKGLKACASIAEVARAADAVFLSLPTGADVQEVCLGEDGIAASPARTRIIVDMSTSPVTLTRETSARLSERDIAFIDAPVARTRQAAHDGTLSIMVGGERDVLEAVRPYLSCMGTEITHCGGVGCGQVVKIMNNMVLFITVNALAEALAIARAAGVDGGLLFDTMAKGSSDSFAVRNQGRKFMAEGKFPEDVFPTDYAIKDIRLALQLAQEGGISAQTAEQTFAILEATRRAGYAKNYYPALIKVIEKGA